MAESKKGMSCVHSFLATDRKSLLKVESISKNTKAKPGRTVVTATVFKCTKCGAQKEYPDSWEKSFRLLPI